MRVALVSPYSWTYPGGVTRHIEALAGELVARRARRARPRALRPRRPPHARCCTAARGRRRGPCRTGWSRSGRTIGWPSNGAVSNLAPTPYAVSTLRRELRAGDFDVVHVHEPVAPVVGWDALTVDRRAAGGHVPLLLRAAPAAPRSRPCSAPGASSTTCRCGSPSPRPRPGPAGASTAAATGSSPTACALPTRLPAAAPARPGEPLRIASSARRRAQGAAGAAARLRGAAPPGARRARPSSASSRRSSRRCCSTARACARSAASTTRPSARRCAAPTCCARRRWAASRSGWCSPRRSPPARPSSPPTSPATATSSPTASTACSSRAATRPRLAEALRDLALDPARAAALGAEAARSAERYAWPRVAERGRGGLRGRPRACRAARDRVRARPRCASARVPADGRRAARRGRLPSLEPPAPRSGPRCGRPPRRCWPSAGARRRRRGTRARAAADRRRPIGHALLASSPTWVLVGLALMCASMLLRAVAWHAILRAALPDALPRLVDAMQGTHDRRADVGHAAGPPRRALARADRRPPPRAPARAAARSCSARSSPRRCSTCSRW